MFGEDNASHTLSHTFKIFDSQARGFTRLLANSYHKTIHYYNCSSYDTIHVYVIYMYIVIHMHMYGLCVSLNCSVLM